MAPPNATTETSMMMHYNITYGNWTRSIFTKGRTETASTCSMEPREQKLGINEVPISTIQALLQDKINEGKHLSRISIYLLFVYVCDSLMIEGGL